MLSTDSALCISTLILICLCENQGTEALDPSNQSNKAHLIQNPYFRGLGPDGTYQDFYEVPSQFDMGWKRAPSAGFYGMRGKKAPATNNFYGMRGKKGPVGFLGMRGKKMDQNSGSGNSWLSKEVTGGSEEERVMTSTDEQQAQVDEPLRQDTAEQQQSPGSLTWQHKRVPVQGFMGLRGKRSSDYPAISDNRFGGHTKTEQLRRLQRLH